MATISDNLNPPQPPQRVFYATGRMLGVEDFQADQDYHRSSLARALLQLCGTGTVAGLKVVVPQVWQAGTAYAAGSFVYDGSLCMIGDVILSVNGYGENALPADGRILSVAIHKRQTAGPRSNGQI